MAARAVVEERKALALLSIQQNVPAIAEALGIDAVAVDEHVAGGDGPYKEMVRAEQMAKLLGAIREKVAPATKPADPVSGTPDVPIGDIAKVQDGDSPRKPGRKPGRKPTR